MLTRHPVPVTTKQAWIAVVLAGCVCVSAVRAQGSALLPAHVFKGAFGLSQDLVQDGPVRQTAEPQLQTVSADGYGFSALSPETQGDLLMVHQRYLAAIEAYQRAPRDSAVIWNKLGIAYQHMYALDFAKTQYEKALFLDSQYAEAMNNLGTVLYAQKNYHKAEKLYRKALVYKPRTASFYSNLGTAYFAEHKFKQGIEAYQQAFALDPEIFTRESLERITEAGPVEEQARLNYTLAKMYAQAGNMKAALAYLRAAFSEGFGDRKKLMADKELAALRETPEFHLLMAEEHFN